MAADSERLYVLGDRGLQITAPDAQWVADSIQVTAGKQLIRRGQYLFLVGDRLLEVVDVGPYLVAEAPASAAASQ